MSRTSERVRPAMFDLRETLQDAVAYVEHCMILSHLFEVEGNVTKACKTLGISRQGFYDKCERYGIDYTLYRRKLEKKERGNG